MLRWHVIIIYRTEIGSINVEHYLEELDELAELVERGPHWDTVEKITLQRVNHVTSPTLTVEAARKL